MKPNTIAVDLTPVLPGGENGGAKLFVLELVSGLASQAPHVQFVLLTQAASHEELAILDRNNVHRLMVIGELAAIGGTSGARSRYTALVSMLPGFVRARLAQGIYGGISFIKRLGGKSVLRKIGADLLFCPFTAPTFYEPSVPTVCTVYDLQFATYPHFFEPEDLAQRKSTFLDACRKAVMLVGISDYTRNTAITYGKLPSNRIQAVSLRMAQRMPSSDPEGMEALESLGVSSRRYLLYPANFWKHKNHEMLLTAFGMACSQGLPHDIKLVCTGAPSARRDFIQIAAAGFGLAQRILFPGYLSNVEFSVLMRNAGGLVFPSLYEGFGMPILEAMAMGVPVACSNVTALPEVAGNAAVLFDPKKPFAIAKALVDLITDEPLRQKLINNGHCQSRRFSDSEQMFSDYWRIFDDSLSKRLVSKAG